MTKPAPVRSAPGPVITGGTAPRLTIHPGVRGNAMKITIDIDCVPPSKLGSFWDAGFAADAGTIDRGDRAASPRRDEQMSPEAVLQQWFGAWPASLEQMRLALEKITKGHAG
jgi:hypothetical protein